MDKYKNLTTEIEFSLLQNIVEDKIKKNIFLEDNMELYSILKEEYNDTILDMYVQKMEDTYMSYDDVVDTFNQKVLPAIIKQYGEKDKLAVSEGWGMYLDGLNRSDKISDFAYQNWIYSEFDPNGETKICDYNDITFDEEKKILQEIVESEETNILMINDIFYILKEKYNNDILEKYEKEYLNSGNEMSFG